MNGTEAADLLTEAICSDFASLTTLPTDKQAEAIRSVQLDDIAPGQVCAEMEVPRGSTWGAVVREISADVTQALNDPEPQGDPALWDVPAEHHREEPRDD